MGKNKSENTENKNHLITNSSEYMDSKKRTLEQRLKNIEISPEVKKGIITEKTIDTISDKFFGKLPFGDLLTTVLNWNQEVDAEISEAKKIKLFEEYFNKIEETEEAVSKLTAFLTNAHGNVIFNKILRILDNFPPDEDLIIQLASTLKKVVKDGEFEELFSDHKYVLTQIENLSPQALVILIDYKEFPTFKYSGESEISDISTSSLRYEFLNSYCKLKGITKPEIINRMNYSILELIQQGYIVARKIDEDSAEFQITTLGHYLASYLER